MEAADALIIASPPGIRPAGLWNVLLALNYEKPGARRLVGPYYEAGNNPESEYPHERGLLSAAYAEALGFFDLRAEATSC